MKKLFLILLCCLVLCGCSAPAPNTESEPSTIPTPELTTITVYIASETWDGFDTLEIAGENLTFLDAMIQAEVLPENTVIHRIEQSGDTLTVDFGPAFRDLICSQGTTGEYLTVGSVVNTLITLHDVSYVQITVDGNVWESGHTVYDFPMAFFQ